MTVKELQKLKRQELLELLVEQGKEIKELKAQREEKDKELLRVEDSNIRLTGKVDEKDAQIDRLMGRLEGKKDRIRELEAEIEAWYSNKDAGMKNSGTVAEAALRLNGIVDAAQRAADQYLYNIRQRYEGQADTVYMPPDTGSTGGPER